MTKLQPGSYVFEEDVRSNPEPSGLYPIERVDIYAGSFTAFFDVMAIPSTNRAVGGILRVTGLPLHGLLIQWEDPVGGRVWQCEFVGVGMDTIERE